MRRFVDLHLIPPLKDLSAIEKMVNLAFDVGLSTIAFTFPMDTPLEEIEHTRVICREAGVDFASRTDLSPSNPKDLIRVLRRVRKKFEIIGVFCHSQTVAKCAAKDSRVDLLNFPVESHFVFGRYSAHFTTPVCAALEIDVINITRFQGVERARIIGKLSRQLGVAKKLRIPIVISSGAMSWNAMRGPMDMATLVSLLGLDLQSAIEATSTSPMLILTRNRTKLDPSFVTSGVRFTRGKTIANAKDKT
jgi:RNase P/RNase MRP subunit p30